MGRSKKSSKHVCKVAGIISVVHTTPGLPDLLWWLHGGFSLGCYTKIRAE